MDAFGNRIPGTVEWAAMDSPGPKEHLTGKMLDELTALYYFHARWYDPAVGRFVGRDSIRSAAVLRGAKYVFCQQNPLRSVDPNPAEPEPKKV